MRLLGVLVGLAVSFAFPTFAQSVDPQLRAVVDAIDKTFNDSQNSGDPAPILAVFAKDGVLVTNQGSFSGQGGAHEILYRSIQGGEIQQLCL